MFCYRRCFALAACLLFVASPASSQDLAPKEISFSGYPAASQDELLAVTGLHAGAVLSQDTVQAAAQKLDDTGMFNSVRFQFDGRELRFLLEASPNIAPISFANFPWWTNEELERALEARLPLFHGSAPLAGELSRQIADALAALVATKGVQATIASVPDVRDGKVAGIQFRIARPGVQIGSLSFTGISPDWSAAIAKFSIQASGQAFVKESATGDSTATDLKQSVGNLYRERGYLDAEIVVTHQAPTFDGSQVLVPATIAVTEGKQYRAASIVLSGTTLVSQDDFSKFAKLKTGDIADQVKLRESLALLKAVYENAGYIAANVIASPSLHVAQQTVDYTINVFPGDLYHMGDLQLDNLTADQQTRVLRAWTLKKGAVYDPTYVRLFLKNNARELQSMDGYSASYEQTVHTDTRVVDLVVTFRQGGTLN